MITFSGSVYRNVDVRKGRGQVWNDKERKWEHVPAIELQFKFHHDGSPSCHVLSEQAADKLLEDLFAARHQMRLEETRKL